MSLKLYDEAVYQKLPVFLQNLGCSFEGWRIQRSRFGAAFKTVLGDAEKRSFWSKDQIEAYRNQRLSTFVHHCYHTVPYYKILFDKLQVLPEEIKTLQDLQNLPILSKNDVQDNYPALVSSAVAPKERIIAHTSGTTGGGLRFATTLRAIHEQWAVWWRYRRWHGIEMDTWCGYFGGRSVVPLLQKRLPFWRYNIPGKQILFSAYHLSESNLFAYVDELRRRRPPWLHGYPSVLALLAGFVAEKRIDLGYQVRWITIGAENLMPQQSDLIEKAFGVRPIQHYGMAEAVANISQCDRGALHVDEDFSAVEFIPNPAGEGFKVVGTNFSNPATPLLRYDVQDCVTIADTSCPCGRPGRVVQRIDGRKEDYVVLGNGARLGRMDHIFKDLVNIREAQIYQKAAGEMTVRIVKGTNYSKRDEALLLSEARKRVGDDMRITIEYVERLARSRTGKLRFVVSEIPEGKISQASQ